MNDQRQELIMRAAKDKMGLNPFEIFTADDILLVAGISEDEMKTTIAKIEKKINDLASKAKK